MAQAPIREFVSAEELHRLFAEMGLENLIQQKALSERVTVSRHVNPPKDFIPFCTHSQMVEYRDPQFSRLLTRVHRYLRPDGTLGASGRPDPKLIVIGDKAYVLREAG